MANQAENRLAAVFANEVQLHPTDSAKVDEFYEFFEVPPDHVFRKN